MNALLILSLTLPLSPTPVPEPAAPVLCQDEEPEDNREEIKELIKKLNDHAGKRGKEDQEAIGVIDQLIQEWEDCGPKDRKAVVKAMDKCFTQKRQEADGVRQNQLFIAAATALGEMYPESVDVLLSWIDHKSHRSDLTLQRTLVKYVGKSKHEDARKPLLKLLKHHEAQIVGAAAEALGEFEEAEEKDRKESFEELLKTLMSAKGRKDSDYNDTEARERWDIIAAPIITSLQRLSGHTESDAEAWQRWWNKNKREDWGE